MNNANAQTPASAPATPAAAAAPAPAAEPSSDAVLADVFGLADAASDEGGAVDLLAGISDGAEAPASTPDAAAAAEEPGEAPAEKPKADDVMGLDELRAIAAKRASVREQRSAAEARLREVEAELAQLRPAAAEIEAFRADPVGWAEKNGRNPREILRRMHEAALKPGGGAQPTVEQLAARVAQLEGELAQVDERVVEKAVTRQTADAATSAHRREFIALTETAADAGAPAFPLLALEPPARRLELAQEALVALREAGHTSIDHQLVAKTLERSLRADVERKAQALGLHATGARPDPTAAPSGGAAAPSGATAGGGARGTPRTITQEHAASPAAERPLTERERNAQAEKLLATIFGGA